MYGMNANFDATAANHGVPISTRHGAREEEELAAVYEGLQPDISKTQATSLSEDRIDEKTNFPARTLGDDEDDKAEMTRRQSVVQALALSYSGTPGENPFMAGPDSPLNPHSLSFSGREWAKAVVELVLQDGASFRSAGVCFQNLNVHGFGAATDYQKDVGNVWLSAASALSGLVGSNRQRINILRHFDGLVCQGEMLVVLGPPGSGCSTFLKTIAGEMNGLFVDDGSYFNYQGKSASIKFFAAIVSSAAMGQNLSSHGAHMHEMCRTKRAPRVDVWNIYAEMPDAKYIWSMATNSVSQG